jgi:hypothetical protein
MMAESAWGKPRWLRWWNRKRAFHSKKAIPHPWRTELRHMFQRARLRGSPALM